jgi:hypothetical protein
VTWSSAQFSAFATILGYFICSSVHPCLSSTVLLHPLVGLRPAPTSFILSLYLTMPTVSLYVLSKTQLQKAFSLNAGASHSDTHHLNWYMVLCGCHESLTSCSTTVLFLANFSLYPIQLCFRWLSYLNHSFQLISIHCSVHQYDPPRKHQSCYQKPFISTSNWTQAHIQRHISCCHSNKSREFIASTVYKIHSLAKSKALAVPERSQNYLPNHTKYRRQETGDNACEKHRCPLAGWFRDHILDRIQYFILSFLSFRIRCAVVSNTYLSPFPCLNANELRTYSEGSW